MYKLLIWDDIEAITDDVEYDKCIQDESYIDTLIENEKQYLTDQGIVIVKSVLNGIIINSDLEFKFLIFPTNNIHECDGEGNIKSQKSENIQQNTNKIKNVKAKIIVDYFRKNNIKVKRILIDKNIITFDCPICQKDNEKMWIFIDSFVIKTHSKNDCENDKHQKRWNKYKNDLKKIWDESKEKKNLIYNYNADYLNKIIKEKFPPIIRQKMTHLLFIWNEAKKYYIEMKDNDIQNDFVKLIQDNMFNDCKNLLSLKQVAEAKEYIKHTYDFPIKDFEPCYLYNCKNGVLNIISGELKPHSSKYLFNYCSDIDYNPKADTTKLYKFIHDVVTEDKPLELISKILGHIHYQERKLEKGFLFVGTEHGRNGKGTLALLFEHVIGTNRTVTMHLGDFNTRSFAEYDLKDKALYIEDDYKESYIDNKIVGVLNKMVTRIKTQVHQKNKPAIDMVYTAIPLIQCNKVPKLKADDDGGFYGRWVQVHFNNEFGKRMNEFLKSQLLNDKDVMSSMLNLLIKGYNLLLERKKSNDINTFFKADENNDDWKKQNNPVLQFVDECCVLSANYRCSSRDLYMYYKTDWNIGGSKLSETKFLKILKTELNLITKRERINGRQCMMLYGITCDDLVDSKSYKF